MTHILQAVWAPAAEICGDKISKYFSECGTCGTVPPVAIQMPGRIPINISLPQGQTVMWLQYCAPICLQKHNHIAVAVEKPCS